MSRVRGARKAPQRNAQSSLQRPAARGRAKRAEGTAKAKTEGKTRWEMRSLMTRALSDALAADARLIYLGEDVEHGGYYRVTEGLRARFGRRRIFDWPPDEASLVGAHDACTQSNGRAAGLSAGG